MTPNKTICRGPTRQLPRFTVLNTLLFSSLLASCAGDATEFVDREGGGEEPQELLLGTTSQALGSADPKCFDWGLADKTLIGGGEFLSPASYDPSGCHQAYRLNLVNYDGRKYNGGAVVGYGGAIPTTQATCTSAIVRAYVWERQSNGTMTFIENVHRSGAWIVGYDNVARCLPPVINLERDAGIVPNGARDYRVSMTARTGAGVTVPIAFSTVEDHVISPIDERKNLVAYQQTLNSFSGANLEPWLKAWWDVRNTPAGQIACRRLQIDRGLHAFTSAALIKAGASATTDNARTGALGNVYMALCTSVGTTQTLHDAVKDYVARSISMGNEIAAALLSEMPSLSLATRTGMASNLMAQIPFQALGNLVSKCDLVAGPLMKYMLHGVLPVGVTDATRVVLGSCSSQTPVLAAAGIGFGAPTPGGPSNGVRAMAQCMADLTTAATETRCNDPRSQSAPETPVPNCKDPQTGETGCEEICYDADTGKDCAPPEQAVHDQVQDGITSETYRIGSTAPEKIGGSSTAPAAPVVVTQQVDKNSARNFWAYVSGVAGYAADGIKGIYNRAAITASSDEARRLKTIASNWEGAGYLFKGIALGLVGSQFLEIGEAAAETNEERETYESDVRAWCDTKPTDPLGFCDQYNGPQSYCPADPVLPSNGWYELRAGGPGAHQANVQDLFEHCLCNLVDSDYGAIGNDQPPSRAPALTCPSSKEQRKLECVADPRLSAGPAGEPDRQCYNLLAPNYDADVWQVRQCWTQQCPENNQRAFAMPNGDCECKTLTLTGEVTVPDCTITPMASSGLCTPENPDACFCVPLVPPAPNGGDPFCRYDSARLAGPISNWVAPAGAIQAEAFNATKQVARVRAGGTTNFVYPTLYNHTFKERTTTFRQQVVMNRAPAPGEIVELKAYYTNRDFNVHRMPLDTCNMTNLPVGSLSNCDFGVPRINTSYVHKFEEPFELEMELRTSSTYTTRPALGALSYAPSANPLLTNTSRLPPVCNPSRPIVGIINPIVDFRDVINPNQTYPFPDGSSLPIPLSLSALR